MRPQLRDTLAIFVEGATPVDASFYQAHGADVQNLAEHIATRIKVRASVTPPEDLLNYYSIGVDAKRNGNRVRLTVLVSGYSRWLAVTAHEASGTDESAWHLAEWPVGHQALAAEIRDAAAGEGWFVLDPPEAARTVQHSRPVWPYDAGPPRVADVLFPGCAAAGL
jgi:hypothetical protein